MTQFLPPNLLALFAPRDPINYLPPLDKLPHEKRTGGYEGVGNFLGLFEDPKDTPPPTKIETREERLERKHREKAEQAAYKLEQDIALWDPLNPENGGTTDPFKTLFVARVNYDTTESKLRREFEVFGPIKKIVVVHDRKNGKPRGYAFIEYEHERDMHSAYKHADGKKIDGRRVLVDVERARTVTGWLPRRLGGGLGGTRRGGPDVNVKHSGREDNRPGAGEDRDRRRSRSRSPVQRERGERRRRPSRSRSREREPREPRERSRRERKRRSRDRSRSRDKDRDREAVPEDRLDGDGPETEEPVPPRKERERRRSRSRDRDRKRSRRSRSRSRDRDRDRKRRDRDRRDRDYPDKHAVTIKQETDDDGYGNNGANNDYPDNSGDGYDFPTRGAGGGGGGGSGTVVPKYEDYNSNNSRDDTNSNSNQFNNYYTGGVASIKVEPPDVDDEDN